MSTEHVVARAEEIAPGERRLVTIAGRSLGVFNVGGEFHALHDRCPHHGAPLCRGRVGATTASGPDFELHQVRDGEILRCAWHGWEFEIATGRSLVDPRVRARTYPVRIENGQVLVTI